MLKKFNYCIYLGELVIFSSSVKEVSPDIITYFCEQNVNNFIANESETEESGLSLFQKPN